MSDVTADFGVGGLRISRTGAFHGERLELDDRLRDAVSAALRSGMTPRQVARALRAERFPAVTLCEVENMVRRVIYRMKRQGPVLPQRVARWTDENDAELIRLVNAGLSFQKIADMNHPALPSPITKSAIAGRVMRLREIGHRFRSRADDDRKREAGRVPKRRKAVVAPPQQERPVEGDRADDAAEGAVEDGVPAVKRRPYDFRGCQYIAVEKPDSAAAGYLDSDKCAAQTVPGTAYCEDHLKLCYRVRRERVEGGAMERAGLPPLDARGRFLRDRF